MRRRTLLILWLTVFQPTIATAASYTVTDLGTLGGTPSYGAAINASGQVTGWSYRADSVIRAFLYDGTMHDLGPVGGPLDSASSVAFGINDMGQVTGYAYFAPGLASRAFLYDGAMHDLGTFDGTYILSEGRGINNNGLVAGSNTYYSETDQGTLSVSHAFYYDGAWHDLGTLGGTGSEAFGINSSGQVIGRANTTGDAATHAFLYDGAMHDLGTLGGTGSEAFGINTSGQVIGSANTTDDAATHAFLYDGTMHDLGTLGGTGSGALGINTSGQVVGHTGVGAFLFSNGTMVDLNTLISPLSGWSLSVATGINDVGQITGTGLIGGAEHAFLLTPVPEPSSLLLAELSALCLVCYAVRRVSNAFRTTMTIQDRVATSRKAVATIRH